MDAFCFEQGHQCTILYVLYILMLNTLSNVYNIVSLTIRHFILFLCVLGMYVVCVCTYMCLQALTYVFLFMQGPNQGWVSFWDARYFYFLRLYLMEPVGFGWVGWILSFGDLLVSCPSSLQGWGSRHTSLWHFLCVFRKSKLSVSCLWGRTHLPRSNIGSLKRRDIRKCKRQVIELLSQIPD